MNEVIIEINGIIDSYGWQRYNLSCKLNEAKGKPVRCKINSFGGSVNDAIAIADMFKTHGNVTVEFIGMNASAVTWMAFGAKKIIAHEDTLWLCHKSSVDLFIWKSLNADQLDAKIEELKAHKKTVETIDLIIAKKYLERCKDKNKTLADVFELMKQERWLTADEAKDWGFIDEVQKGINPQNIAFRKAMIANCAAISLPIPPINETEDEKVSKQTTNPNTKPADEPKKETVVSQIVNGIKEFLHKDSKTQPTNSSEMNKQFIMINSLLKVEGLNEIDGKFTLNAEQLNLINKALQDSKTVSDEVKKATDKLDTISDDIKEIQGLSNKVSAIAAVINRVPVAAPAGKEVPEKSHEDTDSYVPDEVNEVAKEKMKTSFY